MADYEFTLSKLDKVSKSLAAIGERMKCEVSGCESYSGGSGSVRLAGGIVMGLCNKHSRIWSTDKRMLKLIEEKHLMEIDKLLLLELAKGGHLNLDQAREMGRETLKREHAVEAEFRALALEMFDPEME